MDIISGGIYMFETVKEHLNEVIEISDKCPDKYQVKCFEVLLDSLVQLHTKSSTAQPATNGILIEEAPKSSPSFFANHGISDEEWTRVYHFDGNEYQIIANNLKEKVKSGKQLKLALLLGVKNLLETDSADIPKGILIDMCKRYASHDSANFSAIMKKQKNLFLPKRKDWVLTIPGQEKAAEVIKSLAL